jgi:Ser/Thr protein kinase RdoA (MazF antagonist)
MAFPSALRAQALLEFGLPAAPQRVDEVSGGPPGTYVYRIQAPAGAFLLVCAEGALPVAFEATLFDLLAESRYPAPRPRRARSGAFMARVEGEGGHAGAACYPVGSGEVLDPSRATTPQYLELGRLLARLHQLGEAHPASVPARVSCSNLAGRLPPGDHADRLGRVLRTDFYSLPSGASHGRLGPQQALYIGDRVAAVLPSGEAHSGPLVLDLAQAASAWAIAAAEQLPAFRAVLSGYQALRRLDPEERDALYPALLCAAAQQGAHCLIAGRPDPLAALSAVERLGEKDLRAAAG